MTALARYQRLEASGIWRRAPGAQRREVVVSFGDATLVLSDPRSETPLSHWSLPAVTRRNPGHLPALYSPDVASTDEELEVADPDMIGAIEQVHAAIAAARPRRGRLRGTLTLLIVAGVTALAVWWLPGAARQHAARIAPPAQRAEIGRMVLADLVRTTGTPCRRPTGEVVAERLAQRVLPPGGRIVVLPDATTGAIALPGGLIVIGRDLLRADRGGQDVAIGHILAADVAADHTDPLVQVLQYAGVGAAVELLTTGLLPGTAVTGYGDSLLAARNGPAPEDALLDRFAAAGLSSEPYARDMDPSGEATLALIEADPYRVCLPEHPVLSAEEWTALRAICDP